MGFIYIIKDNINNMMYVGQTIRNVQLRFTEHKSTKNRLLSNAIKKYGKSNFSIFYTCEVDNEKLDEEELKAIKQYDTLYPKGYNSIEIVSNFKKEDNILGGSSVEGHDKQSLQVKQKYNAIECLKDLGEIPRGISYWKGTKKTNGKVYEYHGFKVRKVNIKNKEFIISINSKKNLSDILIKAKNYLNVNE